MRASELLSRTRKADYTKYQVRRDMKSWHVWCPACVAWMCCRDAAKFTLNGYTSWAQATASLETHRKIWHT